MNKGPIYLTKKERKEKERKKKKGKKWQKLCAADLGKLEKKKRG